MADTLVPAEASVVAGEDRGREAQHEQQQGGGQQGQDAEKPSLVQLVLKLVVLYMSFTYFTKHIQGSRIKEAIRVMEESERDGVSSILKPLPEGEKSVSWMKEAIGLQSSKIPQFPEYDARGRHLAVHKCTFPKGQKMDLYVYLTDSEEDPPLWLKEGDKGAPKLLWTEKNLVFASDAEDVTRSATMNLDLPPSLLNNGSAWAHIYLSKTDTSPNPRSPLYNDGGVAHHKAQLNKFVRKPKAKQVQYLIPSWKQLEGDTAADEKVEGAGEADESDEDVMINYWKPTLHLAQIDYLAVFQRNHIPPAFAGHITFQESTGNYHPTVYVNEFWLQSKHLIAINETVQMVPLELTISPMGIWKFQAMAQLETKWATQAKVGMADDGDQDALREMLAETNPIILVITLVVSILHSVFNFLAFKNDISFWRNKKKSYEGISVRGMLVNLFFQVVIFLYLVDNNTTSMVLVSNAIGLVIEVWKVGKFIVGRLDWGGEDGRPLRTIPRLAFRNTEVYRKSSTKEFDDIATHHLLYLVAPLMVGYGGYSLLNHQHKGWYSWILNSLVGFVYMFGFVMMTPQLFINYKLKSVAHMPWRVMTYKAINTFIDDMFAFVVPTPTLHRIACFRDDVIFFVFLYQRYLYPVDQNRQNEFGQSAVSVEDAQQIREAQADVEPREARVPRRSKTGKMR